MNEWLHNEWLRLVAHLDSWASSASANGPGLIEVTMHDGRCIYVEVTPDDLDDLFTAFGQSQAFDVVTERLAAQPLDANRLIYTQYWLEPR